MEIAKTTTQSHRDVALARFLTQLAIDESLRASFNHQPEAALDAFPEPLSDAARAAIIKRNSEELLILLAANQSGTTKTKVTRTGTKKKSGAKKTTSKKTKR
jgi:hypothetical protein